MRPDRTALVAYFVLARFAGQGYAREAVAAMLDFLRQADLADIAIAEIDTRNERSIRLVEALGFRKLRMIAGADHFKGSISDEWVYGRPLGHTAGKGENPRSG